MSGGEQQRVALARALTQVKAVDDAYPLVSNVLLPPDISLLLAHGGSDVPGAVTRWIAGLIWPA